MLVPIAVEEVMTADVETVDPGETVVAAARRLRAADVGSLVVLDNGEPTGIITETDLVGILADGDDPTATTVEAAMSAPLVTVAPDAELEEAARLFDEAGVKKLPVVEDGALVGIITTTDLARYVPVLAERSTARADAEPGGVSLNVRPDTAYERDDWEFAYEVREGGSEDRVEVDDVARFSKTLSAEDVEAFADATGDTNRLHLDDEFAANTRFGRRIVHGTLTTGVISAALARLPGLTIYLSKDFHFLGPVDVGERVTAVCRVTEDLGRNKYQLSTTVRNADGEAVVSGSATVLVDDLPGPGAGGETAGTDAD